MKKQKKKGKGAVVKPRNPLVPVMWLTCKPGSHLDRKKEAYRKACRSRVSWDG
jgi:hypothetical protein